MSPVIHTFESRELLEVAYRNGELVSTETYTVKNSPFKYRISPVRKGLIEIPVYCLGGKKSA